MSKKFKPYYAVIFSSTLTEFNEGYTKMAEKMINLAKLQDGFIGVESARNDIGITVSYWENLDAIKQWKQNTSHLLAQQQGKQQWYSWYKTRICKVEREYDFTA